MVVRPPAVVVLRTLVHTMLVREVTPEGRWLLRELGKNEGACHNERRFDESHVVCSLLCLFVGSWWSDVGNGVGSLIWRMWCLLVDCLVDGAEGMYL